MKITLLLVTLGSAIFYGLPQPLSSGDVTIDPALELIPTGTTTVDVMELMVPPRLNELTARFQESVRKHNSWLVEYVGSHAEPGVPLPYHPNMGLTRAEYAEMLELSGQMQLRPSSQTTMTITESARGVYRLDAGAELPELVGISIDLNRDEVRTPFGSARDRSTVEPNPEQQTTGPWRGIAWKSEELDEARMTGYLVKFYLGRLVETGRGILYYDAKRLSDGRIEKATRVLTWAHGDA